MGMFGEILTQNASPMSLSLPADQTFEEWRDLGQKLCEGGNAIQWWIGDWWVAGQHRYGDRAKVAAQGIFGKAFGTLANYGSVARSFETSRRREVLSFKHHVEVAALRPSQADALLDKAAAEGLSTREVREAVRTVDTPSAGNADESEKEAADLRRAWNRASAEVRADFLDFLSLGNDAIETHREPYRHAPADFVDTYVEHGVNGCKDIYRAHLRNIQAWVDENGGPELVDRRLRHLSSIGKRGTINRDLAQRIRRAREAVKQAMNMETANA